MVNREYLKRSFLTLIFGSLFSIGYVATSDVYTHSALNTSLILLFLTGIVLFVVWVVLKSIDKYRNLSQSLAEIRKKQKQSNDSFGKRDTTSKNSKYFELSEKYKLIENDASLSTEEKNGKLIELFKDNGFYPGDYTKNN